MPIDKYKAYERTVNMPAGSVIEITPDDTVDLEFVTIALNVATAGSVRVTTLDGDVTDVFLAAGIAFPIRVTRVWANGTSATGIRGLS